MDRRDFIGKSLSAAVAAGLPLGTAVALSEEGSSEKDTSKKRFQDKVASVIEGHIQLAVLVSDAVYKRFHLSGAGNIRFNISGFSALFFNISFDLGSKLFSAATETYFSPLACKGKGCSFSDARSSETTLEEWEWIHNTNVRGVFLAMKYQIPHLLKNRDGNIVLTASMHTVSTRPGAAAYASSKRALMGLAQTAAMDYGQDGIRVNVLSPGITDTPMFRRSTGDSKEKVNQAQALVDGLKRIATAEEMAEAALFLASNDCPYITGTSLLADGGMMSGL